MVEETRLVAIEYNKNKKRNLMRCFNHAEYFAVGNCKYCMKALCQNCIELTNLCVSCKNIDCQDRIKVELKMIEFSKNINVDYGYGINFNNLIIILMGLMMGCLGIPFKDNWIKFTSLGLGTFLIIFGFKKLLKKTYKGNKSPELPW